MNQHFPRRALVSVSDKTELASFVGGLVRLGFEIVSTGGTRKFLEEQGLRVIDVSSYTGFPEIMEGRVKTLHPKVHGAILGRPDLNDDRRAIEQHGIIPFELVVCNLYPFEATIARRDAKFAEAIEQIDIGGPSMIRAAAKNHAYVGVVTQASQYERVLDQLSRGPLGDEFRRELAAAAFEMTALYDRAIADYLATHAAADSAAGQFPQVLRLDFVRRMDLRYGENPHQSAALYAEPRPEPSTLAAAEQLHGKELSYNNLLDLESALAIVREFSGPAAVVIKHNNPCGCAVAETLALAFERAHAGDPMSAFGSVVGLNRAVDLATADELCHPDRFVEAIIAPGYDDDAFRLLTTKPTWKKNVRLMRVTALADPRSPSLDYRRISGGLLVQDRDDERDPNDVWQCVTERQPTAAERRDLEFAWLIARHVKSNAIVFAKDAALMGVGAGQMSRFDSTFLAAHKAGDRSRGCVLASDAFFPFRDGIDQAAGAGITAIIQPGGSRRDDETVTAANEHKLAMLFTGRRHFKH